MTIDHYDTIDSDNPTAMLGVVERRGEWAALRKARDQLAVARNELTSARNRAWSNFGLELLAKHVDQIDEMLAEIKQWQRHLEEEE
jgi:hypothetical protein